MAIKEIPDNLQEVIRYFSDPDVCVEFLAAMRWPDGPQCPACESQRHSYLKTRRIWKCKDCGRQFSVKLGTVFEDSPIPLDKWLCAVWLVVNCKNGVSSWELHRDLKVTQKSAWFMLGRIRLALQDKRGFGNMTKLGGPDNEVECDEAWIGGKVINMHKDRRARYQKPETNWGKVIVMGMLDRTARQIRTEIVPNTDRATLQEQVLSNVKYGTKVYTDQSSAYTQLSRTYIHRFVNHTEKYVEGRVHTNGLENFWSLFKRNLRGTYVSVEPFHLFRYLDEQVFRYNNRGTKEEKVNDRDRFMRALGQIAHKRLTYAELTGKVGETPF
jgi:transposase-like protein